MTKRIQISCSTCAQPLVVDAALGGKQVRCPKCQALSVIPITNAPKTTARKTAPAAKTKPAAVQKTAVQPETQTVACPSCQTNLSVCLLATAAMVKCPKCQTQMQVPGKKAAPPTPTPQRTAAKSTTARPPSATHVPQAPELDLGRMDLPGDPPSQSFGLRKPTRPRFQGKDILAWINSHRWMTVIVLLNLLGLFVCIFSPLLLTSLAFSVPIGLLLVILLRIPRLHIVRRTGQAVAQIWETMGTQMASIGAGGLLLIFAGASAKILRLSANNPNLDFSGFADLDKVSGVLISLLSFFLIVALIICLWHFIGLVRISAFGYCTVFSILILAGAFSSKRNVERGGAMASTRSPSRIVSGEALIERQKKRMAEFERKSAEMRMEAIRRHSQEVESGFGPPTNSNNATNTNNAILPTKPTIPNNAALPAKPAETVVPFVPPTVRENFSTSEMRPVKRRRITLPIPDGHVQVKADTTLKPGIKLGACWAGKWYQVTCKTVHQDGAVLVNWDDWPASTYDMTREDLIISKKILANIDQ